LASNTDVGTQTKGTRNRVLKMTIGPKMKVVTGELEGVIRSSFIMCAPHQILLGFSYQGACEKRNAHTDWWGTVWHCYLEVHRLVENCVALLSRGTQIGGKLCGTAI
jgi:hypothetical protein